MGFWEVVPPWVSNFIKYITPSMELSHGIRGRVGNVGGRTYLEDIDHRGHVLRDPVVFPAPACLAFLCFLVAMTQAAPFSPHFHCMMFPPCRGLKAVQPANLGPLKALAKRNLSSFELLFSGILSQCWKAA